MRMEIASETHVRATRLKRMRIRELFEMHSSLQLLHQDGWFAFSLIFIVTFGCKSDTTPQDTSTPNRKSMNSSEIQQSSQDSSSPRQVYHAFVTAVQREDLRTAFRYLTEE